MQDNPPLKLSSDTPVHTLTGRGEQEWQETRIRLQFYQPFCVLLFKQM